MPAASTSILREALGRMWRICRWPLFHPFEHDHLRQELCSVSLAPRQDTASVELWIEHGASSWTRSLPLLRGTAKVLPAYPRGALAVDVAVSPPFLASRDQLVEARMSSYWLDHWTSMSIACYDGLRPKGDDHE
jgi:hypothetical protein